MHISMFLAKLVGLYLVIAGGAALVRRRQMIELVEDMINNPAMMMLSGIMALIIGLLLVLFHNVWTTDWRMLITLIGWLSLLKGIALLYIPAVMRKLSKSMMENNVYMGLTVVWPFFGTYLCMIGFGWVSP